MKHLIHKKWLSIPVTVFLVLVLTAGAVFAAGTIHLSEDQIITQEIEAPVYGTISAPTHNLPSMQTGMTLQSHNWDNAVIVVLGVDGKDKYLHMKLDTTTADLYTVYEVNIMSGPGNHPMDDWVSLSVTIGEPEAIKKLTATGTYTFEETINATAGSTSGPAEVKITYTLEDS